MFGPDPDVEHLRAGLEIIVEASIKIQEVQKISNIAVEELAKLSEGEGEEEGEAGESEPQDMITSSSDANFI